METFVELFKALGDENRLRALLAVAQRELCVCEITELLELAPSTVSKHMSILRGAGLVRSRKQGRWIYYRICCGESEGGGQSSLAADAVTWAFRKLQGDPRAVEDQRRLERILCCSPAPLAPDERCCGLTTIEAPRDGDKESDPASKGEENAS